MYLPRSPRDIGIYYKADGLLGSFGPPIRDAANQRKDLKLTDMNTGIPACDRTYVAHTLEDVFLKFQMGNTTPLARHGAMVAEDLSPVSKEEFNAYRPLLRLALRAGRPIHIPAPNEPEGWGVDGFRSHQWSRGSPIPC